MPLPYSAAYLTLKHDAPAPVQQRNSSRCFFTNGNKCHFLVCKDTENFCQFSYFWAAKLRTPCHDGCNLPEIEGLPATVEEGLAPIQLNNWFNAINPHF